MAVARQINWSSIAHFFGALYNFASKLLWIFVVVAIVTILIQGVTYHSTVVGLISVPKSLADDGYTSDVAAGRLRDAMLNFAIGANTKMKSPEVALHGDLPDIIVPTVGISLDAVATTIHTLFHITRSRNLSGELKRASPHNNLGLILDQQGKTDEAIAEYRKAIELDPKYAAAQNNLAAILRRQGKPESE
jgi:tetratricopeptide (TPR) repeat protein